MKSKRVSSRIFGERREKTAEYALRLKREGHYATRRPLRDVLLPISLFLPSLIFCDLCSKYFITIYLIAKIANLKQLISTQLTSMTVPPLVNPIFNVVTLSSLPSVIPDEISKLFNTD